MDPDDAAGAEDTSAHPGAHSSAGSAASDASNSDSGKAEATDGSSVAPSGSAEESVADLAEDAGASHDGAPGEDARESAGTGGRDVEVPMRVYKTVTVFSTLFAVAFVLGGFLLLDRATDRATASLSEVDPVLAVLGLLGIVAGAAVYAFGTRFRAEGMGTPKDRPDEPPDDE